MENIKTQVEVRSQALPPASLEVLKKLRQEKCSSSQPFQLQTFQLFLRRILSPDSPIRNMLLVHGTGRGKSCSAIQVAEEYIMRPEFQEKRVLIMASGSVQENFKTQIFDVSRVKEDNGILLSQQCTGRRYLDMLKRAQTENLRWEDPESRDKLRTIVARMINDFYEFTGYIQFANTIEKKRITLRKDDFESWVHETFDGRLVIVDEAHNLREGAEKENKLASDSLQLITKIAKGMTLVLLTATPMYDNFQEILFFFNLFLWNDQRQGADEKIIMPVLFNVDGTFRNPDAEAQFRGWCSEYISFIGGEDPFTFPFRIPPPDAMISPIDRKIDFRGKKITSQRKYLPLVSSFVESPQKERVQEIAGRLQEDMIQTIVVSPDGRSINDCFGKASNAAKFQYKYNTEIPFLSPSNLRKHASKFATIIKCIQDSSGIVFVFSNYVQGGVLPFAMALEEHGFEPAIGTKLLENPSSEFKGSSQGKYAFLTSEMSERQVQTLIRRLRAPTNANGDDIRVILGSPKVSEGIDFKNVRQIHILDPWYNMSRIEQIIGRGLRTCSHSSLDFQDQNCTIYLHILRYLDEARETYDEYVYRTFVEEKAKKIAVVKRVLMESSVDCTSQMNTNQLPDAWRSLVVPQRRSQDRMSVELPLSLMSTPIFMDGTPSLVCRIGDKVPDPEYVRPLSSYLDVRDEIFNKVQKLFEDKPIWREADLFEALRYAPEVVTYILESAIEERLKLRTSSGKIGTLENKGGLYAFTNEPNQTLYERTTKNETERRVSIPIARVDVGGVQESKEPERPEYKFPFDVSKFSPEVLDWYIVDQIMKPEEKVDLLLKERDSDKPYVRGLKIDGIHYMVLGDGKIYNERNEKVEPIGAELDAFNMWTTTHMDRIANEIKTNNRIICTLEEQTLKFAAFEVGEDGHIQRIKRTKTIKPKECSFFKVAELAGFVREFDTEFPPQASKKDNQCIFLSLLARQENPKTLWVLPEIWSVLSNPVNSVLLRAKIA